MAGALGVTVLDALGLFSPTQGGCILAVLPLLPMPGAEDAGL